METVLGAVLATAVEFAVLALIIAPRWTVRKIASLWRGLRSGTSHIWHPGHGADQSQSTTESPRSSTPEEHAI
jgi:hypothetical protein